MMLCNQSLKHIFLQSKLCLCVHCIHLRHVLFLKSQPLDHNYVIKFAILLLCTSKSNLIYLNRLGHQANAHATPF